MHKEIEAWNISLGYFMYKIGVMEKQINEIFLFCRKHSKTENTISAEDKVSKIITWGVREYPEIRVQLNFWKKRMKKIIKIRNNLYHFDVVNVPRMAYSKQKLTINKKEYTPIDLMNIAQKASGNRTFLSIGQELFYLLEVTHCDKKNQKKILEPNDYYQTKYMKKIDSDLKNIKPPKKRNFT